jgi:hypothetical protein
MRGAGMTPAAHRLTVATLALCAVVLGVVEDDSVAVAQGMARERAARTQKMRLAEISPPPYLCVALKGRQWRRWVHAQQADGGRWTHDCSYDVGVYL